MVDKDESIFESLLAVTKELTPLKPPQKGQLLITKRKYRNPEEALMQERNGVWYLRDLADPGGAWVPHDYYVPWREIWKKYSPLHVIRVADAPLESLEELAEILYWLPASDI